MSLLSSAISALGLPRNASRDQILAAARAAKRDADHFDDRRASAVARDAAAVSAAEQEFSSEEADGVDVRSALINADVLRRLAARGIAEPTYAQYADELGHVSAWEGLTNPEPVAKRGEPLLRRHESPAVHERAVAILRQANLMGNPAELSQAVYDEAVRQARRELGQ